jgi:WD40 repeat protein
MIRIWDVGRPVATGRSRNETVSMVYSPDGRWLSIHVSNIGTHLYSVAAAKKVRWWDQNMGPLPPFAFNLTGTAMYATSDNGFARWNLATGDKETKFVGHVGRIMSLDVSRDQRTVVSGGSDGSLRIWDAATGRERFPHHGHVGEIRAMGFGAGGAWFASAGADKTVRIREPKQGRELVPPLVMDNRQTMNHLAIHPRDTVVAMLMRGGDIWVWNWATRQTTRYVRGSSADIGRQLEFSPDGRRLIARESNHIQVWDYPEGTRAIIPLEETDHESYTLQNNYRGVKIHSDEKVQYALQVEEYTGKTKVIAKLTPPDNERPYNPQLSPDGRWVFGVNNGMRDRTCTLVYDANTLTRRAVLPVSSYQTQHYVFTPDGRYMMVCEDDYNNNHYVFETLTWTCVGVLEGNSRTGGRYLLAPYLTHAVGTCHSGEFSYYELKSPTLPFSEARGNEWMKALSHANGAEALGGIRGFLEHPAWAVDQFRREIVLPKPIKPDQLATTLKNLESPVFAVREEAIATLKTVALDQVPVLKSALQKSQDPEVRQSLYRLIQHRESSEFVPSAEDLKHRRAVQILEGIGTPDALQVLKTWANAPGGAVFQREAAEAYARCTGQRPTTPVRPILTNVR